MASKAHVLAFPRRESAPPAAKQPLAKSRELIIASGLHSGARITVNDGDLIVVGADEGCDVCLSDSGIAARHAAIALHGPDITIRSLDGAISVDDQQIQTTKRVASSDATVVTLGCDAVRLEIAATAVAPAHSGPQTSTSRTPTLKRRAIALLCFSLFAVVATVLVAQKLDASLAAKPEKPDVAAVQSLLDQQGLGKIVTAAMESHGVVIKGVLDRETATKLRGVIAGSRQPIIDRVITKEDLVEQVRDVFRTQGYEADVTHIDGARVQVGNLDESNERVHRAAEAVRIDVPQLDALLFASPNDATPPADAPPYGNRAGDRIVTRIDGKTAYLVAGAGTRYFKGSKLPSGHTIRRITPEAVQLDRDGQIDWFRF